MDIEQPVTESLKLVNTKQTQTTYSTESCYVLLEFEGNVLKYSFTTDLIVNILDDAIKSMFGLVSGSELVFEIVTIQQPYVILRLLKKHYLAFHAVCASNYSYHSSPCRQITCFLCIHVYQT
ncbi:hypothetical protein WA158_004785 [Blastocystis sp. Blastoise]